MAYNASRRQKLKYLDVEQLQPLDGTSNCQTDKMPECVEVTLPIRHMPVSDSLCPQGFQMHSSN